MEGSRVVPECDRETLWESLREKQAAQLDRLKKSEPKYELVLSFKIWDYLAVVLSYLGAIQVYFAKFSLIDFCKFATKQRQKHKCPSFKQWRF